MDSKDYPSFILKGTSKNGQKKNVKSQDQNGLNNTSSRLKSFGRTYRSISPLIIKSLKVSKNGDSRKELARLTTAQTKIFKSTIKHLGIDSLNDISDQSRNELSQTISEIIAASKNLKNIRSYIGFSSKSLASNIESFLSENQDIASERDLYLIADSNKNNLKIAGLKSTLEFYRTLKSLLMDDKSIKKALKQQVEISILMAKDICFNHDPKASLWDREILFVSLIEPCMNLVRDSWLSLLNKEFSGSDASRIYVNSVISGKLLGTKASIEEMDMGHGNDIEGALDDLARGYSPLIEFFYQSDISYNLKSKLIERQVKLLDDFLSRSWDLTINDIKEYLSGLTEEEVDSWMHNEGSKPMDLSKIEAFFDFDKFNTEKKSIFDIEFNDKDLAGESFYRLIQAWGLTDSLCRMNK